MKFTTDDGARYSVDEYGVHQTNAEPFNYDASYIAIYDDPKYQSKSEALSVVRFGQVCNALARIPESIIDVGYGRGDFMKLARKFVPNVMGYDISGEPVPSDCTKLDKLQRADVICFWDVLEHYQNYEWLLDVDAEVICVSLPWLRVDTRDAGFVSWFSKWKHRKPNEHLHFYHPHTLAALMDKYGWKMTTYNNNEDTIRVNSENTPNILSASFKRKSTLIAL